MALKDAAQVKSIRNPADLSPSQLAEARRIAGELVKLYRAGLLKDADEEKALVLAGALKLFSAAVIDGKEADPA